jgi:hypothetical protein
MLICRSQYAKQKESKQTEAFHQVNIPKPSSSGQKSGYEILVFNSNQEKLFFSSWEMYLFTAAISL